MASYPVWNGKTALLPTESGSVFFDGTFTEPQLNHPECIAFDRDGHIWCGGERGEIFRIAKDGSEIREIASTGGFTLGIALDGRGNLYSCDLKHAAVFRIGIATGKAEKLADGDRQGRRMKTPNFPVIDHGRNVMYVSDSYSPAEPGPGIWRIDLETGACEMWDERPFHFANGMALAPGGRSLYVAETFARRISKVEIDDEGMPGGRTVVTEIDALPDGLAFDAAGRLYISCYEPSLIYRWSEKSGLQLLYYDPEAHTLCHPTNCAVFGDDLYTANLGRWHVSRISGAVGVS